MIHLDTHLVAWLYDGALERIPLPVQQVLEEHELIISPMVALELEYLHEIGRLRVSARAVLEDLGSRIGLQMSQVAFTRIVEHARGLTWTRDPFDRLIVATALAEDAGLVTRDATILAHHPQARWDVATAQPKASARRRAAPRRPR